MSHNSLKTRPRSQSFSASSSSSSSHLTDKVRRAASKVRKAAPLAAACGATALALSLNPSTSQDLQDVCAQGDVGTDVIPTDDEVVNHFRLRTPTFFNQLDNFFEAIENSFFSPSFVEVPCRRVQVIHNNDGSKTLIESLNDEIQGRSKVVTRTPAGQKNIKAVAEPPTDAMKEITQKEMLQSLKTMKGADVPNKFVRMMEFFTDEEIVQAKKDMTLVGGRSITDPEVDKYMLLFRDAKGKEKALWIVGDSQGWKKGWAEVPDEPEDRNLIVTDEVHSVPLRPAAKSSADAATATETGEGGVSENGNGGEEGDGDDGSPEESAPVEEEKPKSKSGGSKRRRRRRSKARS